MKASIFGKIIAHEVVKIIANINANFLFNGLIPNAVKLHIWAIAKAITPNINKLNKHQLNRLYNLKVINNNQLCIN